MITKRIIPCLDVRDGRVVKGVNFEGLNDVFQHFYCVGLDSQLVLAVAGKAVDEVQVQIHIKEVVVPTMHILGNPENAVLYIRHSVQAVDIVYNGCVYVGLALCYLAESIYGLL